MFEKDKILAALKKIKERDEKKNFTQSIDLIINLKDADLKKQEYAIKEFIHLTAGRAKKAKVCAFVSRELKDQSEKICDKTVFSDDFSKWEGNAREIRKLVREYDFFLAQANIMPQVAKLFGKYLGTVGKMPDPRGGQIVPPKGNIEPLVKRLRDTVIAAIKRSPVISCQVGKESMDDEKLAENISHVIEVVEHKLPKGTNNIKNIMIKRTMGKPVRIE